MRTFDEIFAGAPLMALFRHTTTERAIALAEQAWELGIEHVEIPLQSDEDRRTLAELARRGADRGRLVGAGTVVRAEQVAAAVDAGAAFIVSPGFDPRIVEAAHAAGLPALPGVATPSEVQLATAMGLDWLKAFPATHLGTGWFKHVRGPFPEVRFVATGGIDASNARAFLDAGVRCVAVGSALEDPAQLEALAALLRG